MASCSYQSPALPCILLALLLSSATADPPDAVDEESYGVDMFPEKGGLDFLSQRQTIGAPDDQMAPTPLEQIKQQIQQRQTIDDQMTPTPLEQIKSLLVKQQVQLERLENLVEKLDRNIHRLQDDVLGPLWHAQDLNSVSPRLSSGESIYGKETLPTVDRVIDSNAESDTPVLPEHAIEATQLSQAMTQEAVANVRRMYIGGVTVARYKPAWSEHFQFLSAVKVEGEVTCLHVLPHEGEEGLSKYVAVGVETGRVYIFLTHGDLLVDFLTMSGSPISSMLSFSIRRNETMLLTGHSDGMVLSHKLSEIRHTGSLHGDDWVTLSMEHVQSFAMPSSGIDAKSPDKPVTILEVYRIGKMRYILASDAGAVIRVFRENGTFYGMAKSTSQPLAFLRSPNSQRLLFFTETGAASLDLRSMTVRTGLCEGLDSSKVIAYAFDATGRSKAYGFTAEGDMIYVVVSGDTLHFECHVRSKKKLEVEGPVIPYSIKGYLMLGTPTQILVYNTTLQVGYTQSGISMGVPRPLFKASMDEISQSFLSTPIRLNGHPVMACNRDKLVVIGFGEGYVGMYKSNLQVQKLANFNSKVWSSPIFLAVLVLLGGWHFFGRKRDAPMASPPCTMDTAVASSPLTAPTYLRSRVTEQGVDTLMDSRKLKSASQAFAGIPGSYANTGLKLRTPITEQSFRTSSKDSDYMGSAGETSLRSSTVDPRSYLKRDFSVDTKYKGTSMDPKYKGSPMDTSFGSSLATDPNSFLNLEPGAYLKRDAGSLNSRGSTVQPLYKTPSEPNSF